MKEREKSQRCGFILDSRWTQSFKGSRASLAPVRVSDISTKLTHPYTGPDCLLCGNDDHEVRIKRKEKNSASPALILILFCLFFSGHYGSNDIMRAMLIHADQF